MFFMNLLHTGPPSNLARLAKGSGLGGNGGIFIFPPLQQLLYMILLFRLVESDLTLSSYQKTAWQ
jgi:hypothetical protein